MSTPLGSLAEARVEALAALLGRNSSGLSLDDDGFRRLEDLGFDRGAAEQAVDALVAEGRASLTLRGAVVVVRGEGT